MLQTQIKLYNPVRLSEDCCEGGCRTYDVLKEEVRSAAGMFSVKVLGLIRGADAPCQG